MANLALGLADSYTEIGPRAYTIWRGSMYEFFAQDSWKVNSKLHIDYGVRTTTIVGFHPLWGNADYFDGALYDPTQAVKVDPLTGNVLLGTGNPYNGVVIPGFSGFPNSAQGRFSRPVPISATAPPAAACSRRTCRSPTSILTPRFNLASGGLSGERQDRDSRRRRTLCTRMGLLDNIFPGGNSPFQPFVTVNNVSVDNPGASLTNGNGRAAHHHHSEPEPASRPRPGTGMSPCNANCRSIRCSPSAMWPIADCMHGRSTTSTSRPPAPCKPIPA